MNDDLYTLHFDTNTEDALKFMETSSFDAYSEHNTIEVPLDGAYLVIKPLDEEGNFIIKPDRFHDLHRYSVACSYLAYGLDAKLGYTAPRSKGLESKQNVNLSDLIIHNLSSLVDNFRQP